MTHPFKQFTARHLVSRRDTLKLRSNARAGTAADVLDALVARPWAISGRSSSSPP